MNPPTPQPGMADWVKILITALAGVTTGALLEPLKQWISMRNAASRAKKAIYRELGDVYHTHVLLKDGTTALMHVSGLNLFKAEAFEYYYNSHREAFYRIPEWQYLLGMYEFLKRFRDDVKTGKFRDAIPDRIEEEFKFRWSSGLIERKLVEKYARQIQERHRSAIKLGNQ